jgi:glucose/arabinose dehydrogenase
VSAPLNGLPPVRTGGQGGLLDVAVDPEFVRNRWVYWSYSEEGPGGASTAVARGVLDGNALTRVSVIFRQQPKVPGTDHFGSRLAFGRVGNLFVTLGERETDDPAAPTSKHAQNLGNHLGKVVRIRRDGTAPRDNPFVGVPGALPEVYSLGHRNSQGAAINPASGELWMVEHGPQGGDEVNRIVAGHNYGWPLRSYGCPYGAPVGPECQVNGGIHAPQFDEPLATWVPISTAPSGMLFYTGDKFPQWKGSLFVGSLAGGSLWRFPVIGNTLGQRERLLSHLGERIRDVRQGPDGWIYLLLDSDKGRLVRIQYRDDPPPVVAEPQDRLQRAERALFAAMRLWPHATGTAPR